MSGYSPTPLARKLTLKPGHRVRFSDMPVEIRTLIDEQEPGLVDTGGAGLDAIHLFEDDADNLRKHLADALDSIHRDGFIWVSWPKKSSKRPTNITEDTIRDIALPMGLVDIKVCAVDTIWSGLKLVIRKENRAAYPARPD